MPVTIATNHFLAQNGCKKQNCAQAVLHAFADHLGIPEGIIESFKAHGGGRAPEGICGAAYAAEFVLGMAGVVDDHTNVVAHLESLAGSAKCLEIKEHKKMSCLACVETCTAFVATVLLDAPTEIENNRIM